MNIKPSLKRLIGVSTGLILIVGSVSVFYTLILPVTGTIQQLRGEKVALSELYNRELATVKAVKKIFEQFGSVSSLQDTLSLALPTEEDIPSILNQVNGIAKMSGIIIESIDLQLLPIKPIAQNIAIKPVGTVRVSLKIKGTYESIKVYLDAIETNVRIMDVDKLDLEGGTEHEILNYNLVLQAYYQR